MKKKGLFSVVQLVGFVLLLALLVSCPGSPDIKDEGGSPPPITEEDLLNGQWAVMEEEGVETPTHIIDIQHTLPDYWIVVVTSEEPVIGIPFKSDRTGPDKDGVFVISLDDLIGEGVEMSYSFVDNERNTLKAEAKKDDITAMTYILERIPSEEEIKMHIVSFKLDDSISSAGYVLTSDGYVIESLAIEAGKAFGEKGLPSLIGPDETVVPALFTLAGTEFTKDTPVTDDITVIVAPDVGDEGPK